jgi:type IV pilus assembly protein PilB
VVDVLGRFLNMGVDPYNFVSALNCILAEAGADDLQTAARKYGNRADAVGVGLDPQQ